MHLLLWRLTRARPKGRALLLEEHEQKSWTKEALPSSKFAGLGAMVNFRKAENRTGNRLTEPVFKTARKPETNHKPNRTEPNRNRTVSRFAGAASVKATNPHYWPLLFLIFASAVLATHETLLKFGKQTSGQWRRQQHHHGIPFQSGRQGELNPQPLRALPD